MQIVSGASAVNYYCDFRDQSNNSVFKIDGNKSANFAGAVDVGTFSLGTSGIRLTNSGTIYIGGTGSNAALSIGNSHAVIKYDGSADLAGGDLAIDGNGQITAYSNNDSQAWFKIRNTANNGWGYSSVWKWIGDLCRTL